MDELKNYVLIDFENVQPGNLEILSGHPYKVLVFVGARQAKVPFALAEAMQHLGDQAKYVKISGTGKNALDFHIAYYVGKLAAEDPKANFHIISKDRGFDPLITHLKENKIRVQRENDLAEIPLLRMSTATSDDEKVAAIVKNLVARGQSRPRKVKTLANTIDNLFKPKLDESELTAMVRKLERCGYIIINGVNVSYRLSQ